MKMKRNISRVLIGLLLMSLIPFCCILSFPDIVYKIKLFYFNTPAYIYDPLESEITHAFSKYENGEIPFVDFSSITSFEWDRLFIIGPYSTYKDLTYRFGTSWMSCFTRTWGYDGHVLLVFASDNKIVRCFDYPVYPFNLSGLADKYLDGIPAQDALFISHGIDEYVELMERK